MKWWSVITVWLTTKLHHKGKKRRKIDTLWKFHCKDVRHVFKYIFFRFFKLVYNIQNLDDFLKREIHNNKATANIKHRINSQTGAINFLSKCWAEQVVFNTCYESYSIANGFQLIWSWRWPVLCIGNNLSTKIYLTTRYLFVCLCSEQSDNNGFVISKMM